MSKIRARKYSICRNFDIVKEEWKKDTGFSGRRVIKMN